MPSDFEHGLSAVTPSWPRGLTIPSIPPAATLRAAQLADPDIGDVLRNIEDGEVDQHEGSFIVGTILKEIYIDSALKKGDKLDAEHATDSTNVRPTSPVNDVSWAEFKKNYHKN